METTNSNSTNETYFESSKLINQWYGDVASAMTELYKRQLNLTTGFYSNLFGALGGNNHIWNPMKNFSDMFNVEAMRSKVTPFGGSGSNNGFVNPFEKTFQQIAEYNQNLIQGFSKKMENGNDWSAFNQKFQQTLEKEFESSKKLMTTLIESYNKRMENSLEINKDLQKEFQDQLNQMFELNKQLWAETTKAATTQTGSETEKFSKNGNSHDTEVKKNSKVSVAN